MEELMLSKVRKLNWVLQESVKGSFSFEKLCDILSELTNANVYIVDTKGKIIGVHYKVKSDSAAITDPETGAEKLPIEYNDELLKITATAPNISEEDALKIFKYDYDTSGKFHTIVPVLGGGQRWGTLVLTRYSPEFNDEDLVLGEYGATLIALEIQRQQDIEEQALAREKAIVQMAVGTLSYSEIEAVQQIFAELGGSEGLLVASKVADRSGITRSVIVNALRKLESAGVVASRSLGMKGTHIKITNPQFKEELKKLGV